MKIPKDIKEKIIADNKSLSINQISKKYNLPPDKIKKIIYLYDKNFPKWFYVVLVLIPVVCLILLEIFLRAINYGNDFTQWVDGGGGKYIINPNLGMKYFTAMKRFDDAGFNPKTIENFFDQEKKENAFRVFVLGESSALGFPYMPLGSFSNYIRRRLELTYPNTTVEIVNIGMTAINSYALLDLIPGVLDQKPDLILIYTGHNEYYGALGVGSTASYGSSRTLIKLMLFLNNFRITQFIRNSIHWTMSLLSSKNKKFSGTLMSNMAKEKHIVYNSKIFEDGLCQFKENFTDILQMIKEKNVPVILGRQVSNLKDQKPFISEDTPGYKNANQVYQEALEELRHNNIRRADSLFRLAKDLDVLRFRAPEKLNMIIDDLGKEFQVATIPIDSLFNDASPNKIVGDNLIVDHLHPNVKGHHIIGKAFYDKMEELGYLPKTEKAKVPFDKQDSLTRANFVFTKLDSVIGNYMVIVLKSNWPFVDRKLAMSEFNNQDFIDFFKPKDILDSIAICNIQGMSWPDVHLLAASIYLRRDDIENYLKHMNILIYQYPVLRDFNTALQYFYKTNKINQEDYTIKRVGLIALHRGNINDAIKYLTTAYKSNSKDPSVLYNLALAYSKKKDYKLALSIIDECLIVDPNYPEARNLKMQVLKHFKK